MYKKRLSFILAIVLIILCFGMVVYADDLFDTEYRSDRIPEYLGSKCTIDNNAEGNIRLSADIEKILRKNEGTDESIEIVKGDYSRTIHLTADGKKQLEQLAREIYDKESVRNKVKGMSTVDISADTEGAGNMLSGLEPIIKILLGLVLYGVVVGMTVFTAFDLCYITMPIFRNKTEEMKQSGNGMMVKTDNKTGETSLRLVTDDAQYAVKVCAVNGKNPLVIYLRKRIWAYIALGVVIYILFTGNISLIVNIAINIVEGLLDVLAGLGK